METNYSSDQETFRSTMRRFLDEQANTKFTRQQWREPTPTTPEIWQTMTDLGVTSLLVPEQAGGVGGSMADMGIVMEELGRVAHPGPAWSSCVGATSAAVTFELATLMAGLADGSQTATLAVEESARSFSSWQTPQLAASDNRLSGEKVQVPDAIGAKYLFVTTDNGVYLVSTEAAGLSITPTDSIDGSRRFARIRFDNVAGEWLGSNSQLGPVIDRMLVALCADGLGAAQKAMELAVSYASERYQFDQPIGSFQAIQHMCSDMLQQLELGRAGLHYALWAVEAGDPLEGHRAAVMCKAYMSETFPQIGANAIQIFGGAGFTWEYDIHLFYKRLLSLQMTWGDAAVWLEELAKLVIDQETPAVVPSL